MPFRTEVSVSNLVGIGIDLTETCNRNCPTCFAARTPCDMNWQTFQRIVDQGVECNFSEFYILGGEPTLHPEIIRCLEYAQGKFSLVFLVTNMDRLADVNFCRKVEKTGVVIAGQRHTLALNGDASRQERLLTGGNHLKSSHAAWKNVASIFPANRVCVQCCITKPVVQSGSIFEVFRWCRKNGYEPVMEFTKEGGGFKRGCVLDVDPSEIMRILEEFRRIDQQEFGLPGADLLSPQAYGKTCHMQETSIHFRVNGEAIPCVGYPALSYGNVVKSDLQDILKHPLRAHIKNPHEWVYGYCRNECRYFDSCTGGCRGSSFDMSGCYRASFYYCPHIPHTRLSLSDMIPPTCAGCPLENNPACHPQR